jgi:hypothetical protein
MTNIKLVNEELDYELDLKVYDSWSELNLESYFKIISLIQNKDNLEETLFFVEIISILSNVEKEKLYEIPVNQLTQFTDIISKLSPDTLPNEVPDTIVIDDITYVPKKNMSNLTTNEMIWIKNKQKESKTSIDTMISILVILLRPGYEKTSEAGVTKWIQTPYDNDDFEARKNIFLHKLSANDGIPLVNFFLIGNEG